MKIGGVFFNVRLYGDEVVVDERSGFRIGIGLGFQPGACASGRGGAEINQQRLLGSLGFRQRRVGVFVPIDGHRVTSRITKSEQILLPLSYHLLMIADSAAAFLSPSHDHGVPVANHTTVGQFIPRRVAALLSLLHLSPRK
jgi:hypothetical protein